MFLHFLNSLFLLNCCLFIFVNEHKRSKARLTTFLFLFFILFRLTSNLEFILELGIVINLFSWIQLYNFRLASVIHIIFITQQNLNLNLFQLLNLWCKISALHWLEKCSHAHVEVIKIFRIEYLITKPFGNTVFVHAPVEARVYKNNLTVVLNVSDDSADGLINCSCCLLVVPILTIEWSFLDGELMISLLTI